MKNKSNVLVLLPIFLFILFVSCNLRGNEGARVKSDYQGANVVDSDLNGLIPEVKADSSSLIFITTSWCNGGALTINSFIYPQLQTASNLNITSFIIYLGEEMREDIFPDSYDHRQPVTIYHISNSLFNNAFVHKYRIRSFLKELDPTYEFQNAIPVTVIYKDGQLRNIRPSDLGDVLIDKN